MCVSPNCKHNPKEEFSGIMLRASRTQPEVESASGSSPLLQLAPRQVSPLVQRRVIFSTENDIIPSMSPLDQLETRQDERSLWYCVTDLDLFRTQVRDLCRQMRVSPEQHMAPGGTCTYSLGALTHTRGLEQRACLERQRRKYMTARYVLRAQKTLTADDLALLAHNCTHWAAVLAREEAARDFVRAYGTDNAAGEQAATSSAAAAAAAATNDAATSATVTSNDNKRGLAELLQDHAATSVEPTASRRRLNAALVAVKLI